MRLPTSIATPFTAVGLFAALAFSGLDMGAFFKFGGRGGFAMSGMGVVGAEGNRGDRASSASDSEHTTAEIEGVYLAKLRMDAGAPRFFQQQQVQTHDPKLDRIFAQLELRRAGFAHRVQPKNQILSVSLGLERTIRFESGLPQQEVLDRLLQHPDVEWVEPVHPVEAAEVPSDPYFRYQWNMAQLQIDKAWELSRGNGVVVAVLDTGVSEGPDGFTHVLNGKDFVDDDDVAADFNGHGTHIAGTIAQSADNEIGVVGVAPGAHILPVRILDSNGTGTSTRLAEGIIWAVDHGADIINISASSMANSTAVEDACTYAYEQGVTVVAATGNAGLSEFIGFPAAYPTTIAVGAVDARSRVAPYSNRSSNIDLVAPGGDIYADHSADGVADGVVQETIKPDGEGHIFNFMQGTSVSTSHVTGLAALLHGMGLRKPDSIRMAMTRSAKDLGTEGWDTSTGYGLIDPVRALTIAQDVADQRSRMLAADSLAITEATTRSLAKGRVVINWRTNLPATTLCKGESGFMERSAANTVTHRIVVSGKPGTKATYNLTAFTDSERVRERVQVRF